MAAKLYVLSALVASVGSVASSNCHASNCKAEAEMPQDETSLLQTKVEATRPLSVKEEIEDEVEKGKRELRAYAEDLKDGMPIANERTFAEPPQHSSNFDDALEAPVDSLNGALHDGCTSGEGEGGQAICAGHTSQVRQKNGKPSVLGQSCGKFLDLPPGPATGRYNFYESTVWVPAMVSGGQPYAYVPATKCSTKEKNGKDDPTCYKFTEMDLFKIYPGRSGAGAYVGPLTRIPHFKAFGSKVTQDGRYLFVCDFDNSRIIALDTSAMPVSNAENQGLVAVFNNVNNAGNPNDIAIWEDTAHSDRLVVFTAGGKSSSGVYSASLGIRKQDRSMQWNEANAKTCAANAVLDQGCDFMKIPGLDFLSSKLRATPAGIGVTSVAGPRVPNLWIATLEYFAFLDLAGKAVPGNDIKPKTEVWGLKDPSWSGNYKCTLPDTYSNGNVNGLIDNVVMAADGRTMITAIYTDCQRDSAMCLATDFGTGKMFSKKNVNYNVVAFTRVCLDKVTAAMLKSNDIAPASQTFIYPLPDNQKGDTVFNGRVTHIQNVGNDLVAINYQFARVMVFPGVMDQILCQ